MAIDYTIFRDRRHPSNAYIFGSCQHLFSDVSSFYYYLWTLESRIFGILNLESIIYGFYRILGFEFGISICHHIG